MSRIGRMPVPIPEGVKVEIQGAEVMVLGPRGELSRRFHPQMEIHLEDGSLVVSRPNDSRICRAQHGLTRTLLANMVTGVSQGFRKDLTITGVGYRAQKVGEKLVLQMGYSHPVEINPPQGISFAVDSPTRIGVMGIDKEQVGHVAAEVRAVRSPDSYHNKGIAYVGERLRRKAGKAGKAGAKR